MLKTAAIESFLKLKTHADLAALYRPEMEVQVNVAKDNGKQIMEGDFRGKGYLSYTDGISTWKPFRIPFNAATEPEYTDSELRYDIEAHCEAIGMTGWNWKQRKSYWVAYDFDAITGHSERHAKKLNEAELTDLRTQIEKIPYATLRSSTSGKGLHLYVFVEPVDTANHSEHAALARAILSMISGTTGFDFSSKVDVCGANMWVWHRKMVGTTGLTVLKSGTILKQIPPRWREHIGVITRKTKKITPVFMSGSGTTSIGFDELSGQRNKTPLTADHKRLIEFLTSSGALWWWDNDNWMLVCHTFDLKLAHQTLGFRGPFETLALGQDKGADINCFCFPIRNGAWTVRRYTAGAAEHKSWEQDSKGYTKTLLNAEPDLPMVARRHDGLEDERGRYVFPSVEVAQTALAELHVNLGDLPKGMSGRGVTVKLKESKLIVSIESTTHDKAEEMKGWLLEKKKMWVRVFNTLANTSRAQEAESCESYDDIVRHIVSEPGDDMGWIINRDNKWATEPLSHVKIYLQSVVSDKSDITTILGKAVAMAWKVVMKPFQPEYPGDREWNKDAPQFVIPPTTETDNLSYPTWLRILTHCGKNLDEAVGKHEWCKENGINSGADYLKLWLACLIKRPDQPSPYLAFWGAQDSGKSIFHEMLELIIKNGIIRADAALTSSSNFNGELHNALVCVIEETDLQQKNKTAYNRIKDWVTSPQLLLHVKNQTPYQVKNYCHFIQTSNERENCPVFPDDTRITLINVDALPQEQKIGKRDLMQMLAKEAPDFLAALLATDIPDIKDRLIMPIISTEDKKSAQQNNMTALERFINDKCYYKPGHSITSIQFFEEFVKFLDMNERGQWSQQRVGRQLPPRFPRGRVGSDQLQRYGNISFDENAEERRPLRAEGTGPITFLKTVIEAPVEPVPEVAHG